MRTGTRVLPDEFPRHVRRSVPAGNEAGAVRHREHVCSWTVSSDGLPAERSASSGSTLSRLLVLLAALGGCTSSTRPMLEVPDVVQSNSWSCGVAVVQAVLQAHGIEGYQDDYARELGTTREAGTHPTRIVALLRKHGLGVELREGMTTDDLRHAVDRGDLVILDFQAWREGKRGSYETAWEDGHYAILIGYEGDRLIVEDPSILGAAGWLTEKELALRWRDYELEGGRRREYLRSGIV